MGSATTISVARDFSKFPAGRDRVDGPFSGARFREELLAPALAKLTEGEHLAVELDGTLGFGSSFLEEAFGGLLRSVADKGSNLDEHQCTPDRLRLTASDSGLIREIRGYISDAIAARKGA